MKKTSVALLALLGLATAAHAQRRGGGSDLSLGLKVGGSLTSFEGTDATPFSYRPGFHAGAFANFGISPLVAIQPELLYSMKGANLKNVSDASTRLHYLDVPVAVHINTQGLFFELGPQVGFLVAASSQRGSASTDIKSGLNSVDFGYLGGLGYQLKQGLGIGLRYNGGFTNVSKSVTVGNTTYQARSRNSAFQLYLTYSFNGR